MEEEAEELVDKRDVKGAVVREVAEELA